MNSLAPIGTQLSGPRKGTYDVYNNVKKQSSANIGGRSNSHGVIAQGLVSS